MIFVRVPFGIIKEGKWDKIQHVSSTWTSWWGTGHFKPDVDQPVGLLSSHMWEDADSAKVQARKPPSANQSRDLTQNSPWCHFLFLSPQKDAERSLRRVGQRKLSLNFVSKGRAVWLNCQLIYHNYVKPFILQVYFLCQIKENKYFFTLIGWIITIKTVFAIVIKVNWAF